jgi:hypothetical protein
MPDDKNNVEISRLQKEISAYLSLGSTELVFEYEELNSGKVRLNLITVNPRHNQSFLFHYVEGYDRVYCLNAMLNYVKTQREKKNSYTIQWSMSKSNELHTSYVRAKDVLEAIEKLHFGRDANSITIFSVVLNPIS